MRKLIALLLVLTAASFAEAATTYRYEDTVRNTAGRIVGGATVSVYIANTDSLATLYTYASTTGATRANPTSSDSQGRFWFYVPAGTYDITIARAGIETYTVQDVSFIAGDSRADSSPQLLYGPGAPTSSPTTGSIYQRTDAEADSTLYLRKPNGNWWVMPMPRDRTGTMRAASGDQTPDVSGTDFIIFSNQIPTTVSNFDNGVDGQLLSVLLGEDNTVLVKAGPPASGLVQAGPISGSGRYIMYRYNASSASWYMTGAYDAGSVATPDYLDTWDPYGVGVNLPVLSDPTFWQGWDADAPHPLWNELAGTCSALLDSTVALTLEVETDVPTAISTMVIADGDTTISNYSSSYVSSHLRNISTGVTCADGDVYRVNYKVANAAGNESPWWTSGVYTVVIDPFVTPTLARIVGTPQVAGICEDGEASLFLSVNSDIDSYINYLWTKVGSGDTSAVTTSPTLTTTHYVYVPTDSSCTGGDVFRMFASLTNEDDVTGQRYGPYTYTVSTIDEDPPAQGNAELNGQCLGDGTVALQLNITSEEPCTAAAQWREYGGTWTNIAYTTPLGPLHSFSVQTGDDCVSGDIYEMQYRLTDANDVTSSWFAGGTYTVVVTPPDDDEMYPIISESGSSVSSSVVNGNTILTVTIECDEDFYAAVQAYRDGDTQTIWFEMPVTGAQGTTYDNPITRQVNTGVVAVQGQTWDLYCTLIDSLGNYSQPPYSNYIGSTTVNIPVTTTPEVTGISGTIEDDQVVTITGSNFGVKSPAAPLVYDGFERDSGLDIDGDPSSPWDTPTGDVTISDAEQRVTGKNVSFQDYTTTFTRYIAYPLSTDMTEMYVTGWWYNEVGGSGSRNFKLMNFTADDTYDEYLRPQCRVDMYPRPLGDGNPNGHLYSTTATGVVNQDWGVGSNLYSGEWMRIERYMNVGTPGMANGHTYVKRNLQPWGELRDVQIYAPGEHYTHLLISHFFSKDTWTPTPWMRSYWDELYIDDTLARVEIGDQPIWGDCTHREIQIPSSWASSSASVTLNQGTFEADEVAYVFVTNSDDRHSNGLQITWGGSGGGTTDTTPPSFASTPVISNESWGEAGVDSVGIVVDGGFTEPAKYVGSYAVYARNGSAVSPSYSDTTGGWSSAFSTTILDTLFTEESWADTISYIAQYYLRDETGNVRTVVPFFGGHVGVPEGPPVSAENDTIYLTFGYDADDKLYQNLAWSALDHADGTVFSDSLYYFCWAPRDRAGTASTTVTASTRFNSLRYEFGGISDPLSGGLATTDTSCVAFSGLGAMRRLSGLGEYVTDAKFYFRPYASTCGPYTFTPSPNFYAAALCTSQTIYEAEQTILSSAAPYNYMSNVVSYATNEQDPWSTARTDYTTIAKYGIGVNTQQTFTWQGSPYPVESWYYHDFTTALQSWYASANPHGVIIAQMGHHPGTSVTSAAYPQIGPWRASSAVVRPFFVVTLVVPQTLRIPYTAPTPAPHGGKDPIPIVE